MKTISQYCSNIFPRRFQELVRISLLWMSVTYTVIHKHGIILNNAIVSRTLQEFIGFLFKMIFCSMNVNYDSGRPWGLPTQCTRDVWIDPAAVATRLTPFQMESCSQLPNMAIGAWFPKRAPPGWRERLTFCKHCHCNLQTATCTAVARRAHRKGAVTSFLNSRIAVSSPHQKQSLQSYKK
jgi:hypothetical protein